jgi:hypothetical protein
MAGRVARRERSDWGGIKKSPNVFEFIAGNKQVN